VKAGLGCWERPWLGEALSTPPLFPVFPFFCFLRKMLLPPFTFFILFPFFCFLLRKMLLLPSPPERGKVAVACALFTVFPFFCFLGVLLLPPSPPERGTMAPFFGRLFGKEVTLLVEAIPFVGLLRKMLSLPTSTSFPFLFFWFLFVGRLLGECLLPLLKIFFKFLSELSELRSPALSLEHVS